MKRLAVLLAALVAVAWPANAAVLNYILGMLHPNAHRPPEKFATTRPKPDWEAALANANPQAGRVLFTTGQTGRTSVRVMVCQSCHGKNGIPYPGAAVPRLAGVTADYIAKELFDYRTGRRRHEVMGQIARQMAPADIGSVAAYLAATPPGPFDVPSPSGFDTGRRLQELGDNARAIPACGNCHGPQGKAVDRLLPPLASVNADYLREQLRAWRAGTRNNDDLGVMRAVTHTLTDDEIASLAGYYAAVH